MSEEVISFNRLDGTILRTGWTESSTLTTEDVFDANFFQCHPETPAEPGVWIYTSEGNAWLWTGTVWVQVKVNPDGTLVLQ